MRNVTNKPTDLDGYTIAVLGVGYVGLPLVIGLSRKFKTIGFDLSRVRIEELKAGTDSNQEYTKSEVLSSSIEYTCEEKQLVAANIYIVAVPTPVDEKNKPNLTNLEDACRAVGRCLREGDIVVIESTVYPGATEEFCLPLLESESQLKEGISFGLGYSPERINPGDKLHSLSENVKVISARDEKTLQVLAAIYGSIVPAGVHSADSIKVAEAAKVIENTQRDINVALINEFALIFDRLGISTQEVLKVANTKWNFLDFRPGLVGGHCLSVDPYYLSYRAEQSGYVPQVLLSGRKVNDSMALHVVEKSERELKKIGKTIGDCRVLILGCTYKENVPDTRNSQSLRIAENFKKISCTVVICDPLISESEVVQDFDQLIDKAPFDLIIISVPHQVFNLNLRKCLKLAGSKAVLFDLKGVFYEVSQISNIREGVTYLTL